MFTRKMWTHTNVDIQMSDHMFLQKQNKTKPESHTPELTTDGRDAVRILEQGDFTPQEQFPE